MHHESHQFHVSDARASPLGERWTMVRRGTGKKVIEARDAPTVEVPALDRWEDDGGRPAPARTSPVRRMVSWARAYGARVRAPHSTVELRTRDILAKETNEGGGPPRRFRAKEWRWLGLGAIVISGAVVLGLIAMGARVETVGVGVAYAAILFIGGTSPAIIACFLRGRAERMARRRAAKERDVSVGGPGSDRSPDGAVI